MNFPKRKNIEVQSRQHLVIVGSRNPVKISCTASGFYEVFEDQSYLVEGLNVGSNVPDQPFGDKQTLQGATNRASNAKAVFPEADYWVGIEGGVEEIEQQLAAFAWVVVLDKNGKKGKAKTSLFFLPENVSKLVRKGMELGKANDKVFQTDNSKEDSGAVGILTKGALDRKEYYKQAVMLALIPFLNGNIYS